MKSSKSPLASKTIWGALLLALVSALNLFDVAIAAEETQAVGEAFATVFGFVLTIYGRMKARVAVRMVKGPGAVPLILCALLVGSVSLTQPGCAQYEKLPAWSQSALKIAAKVAVSRGLEELAEQVPEVAPYRGALADIVELTFSESEDPDEIGRNLAARIEEGIDDPSVHNLIGVAIAAALMAETTTDPGATAGPHEAHQEVYNAAIARAL